MDPVTNSVRRSHGTADRSALLVVPLDDAASAPTGQPRRRAKHLLGSLIDYVPRRLRKTSLPERGAMYERSKILENDEEKRGS
jgi:hypothetical protein